ncbi:NADPH-quinone oxidoreductase [Verrucomicrobia bacterium IMCC26134]|nr:NADPH-quinone oxidoreductase [Verrucomicrobia bacterium IMCC26134]
MNTSYAQLAHALQPEIILADGAVLVIAFDLIFGRHRPLATRLAASLALGALTLVAAFIASVFVGPIGGFYGESFVLDSFALATRGGVIVLALLTLGVAAGAKVMRNPAEYVALILFATTGFTLMAAANHLLIAFASLELASLSLYLLAGFDKDRRESAEAGLKYFLLGALATAFLLFGFSLIYGMTGELALPRIAAVLAQCGMSPLPALALVMVMVAFGFKAAAAPFHLWAPDAYEGAPTPSAALIASASKLAGFTLFTRLLWPGLGALAGDSSHALNPGGWITIVVLLAGASLLIGNLAALAQTNLRRLLAYSAIAHAGVMMLGVVTASLAGPGPLFYYLFTYGIATAGAFGVIAVLERNGGCQKITDLAGLSRRSPLLAGTLAIFILSLAGIPPLAGFFGKFTFFALMLRIGGIASPTGALTLLAIALSAVSLYYYLVVLKQALVEPFASEKPTRIHVPAATALTLLAATALIIGLGLCPSLLLTFF